MFGICAGHFLYAEDYAKHMKNTYFVIKYFYLKSPLKEKK